MRTKPFLKLLLPMILSLMAFRSHAQQEKCGPYTLDEAAFQRALQYEKLQQENPSAPSSPIVIRVFFKVVDPDQGLLFNITEAQIATDFKHLVQAYSPDNICFVNAGYDFVYSTALDTFNTSKNNPNLFLPYGIQNCITVFYIDHLGGTNGSNGGGFSGITYGPLPTAWTIVEKAYIGLGTTEHEVGHCLGLLHTFDFVNGHGLEDIDGSNGSTSADLVADTHADPYAYNNEDKSTCFSTSGGCTYNGTCTDPKGNSNYSPPYTNLMSYWCSAWYPTYVLTTGQYTRITSFLNTAPVLQITESANTVTQGAVNITSGYLMNSAVTTLTTSGSVVISNTAEATLGAGQTVFLEPGFHATPAGTGRVLIRHAFCDTTNASALRQDNENQKANGFAPGSLEVYPNPTSSSVNLKFSLNNPVNEAVIEIYNMNTQVVRRIHLSELNAGEQSLVLRLVDLPAGIYTIVLKSAELLMTSKVVLTK